MLDAGNMEQVSSLSLINTVDAANSWQQRVDPEQEANIGKKRKQRPVSVAIPENVSRLAPC